MCIRDSSENERANHRLNMNLEYQIDSSRSLIFRPTLTYSCLLYTSDAADERSSVDLGGRRIIKKKKNK